MAVILTGMRNGEVATLVLLVSRSNFVKTSCMETETATVQSGR